MILPKKIKSKGEEKIIFLCRINPIKNIIILLESFNKLCELQKFNKLKLLIVGSARLDYEISYLKKLKNFVKMNKLGNRVIFKGSLYGIDKFKEIASSKILILPSKSENFGNVVTESLSQGTPVVASSNTPWSILNDYKAGCWIDSEINSKVLYDEILKILELNKKEFNNLRKQALNLCKKEFDINLKIHEWINLYKSL